MKVVVTGATGFVGQVIVKQLLASGDEVVVLTRNVARAAITLGSSCKYFQWDDTNSLPPVEAFQGVDGIINLMGESISKRWDENQKKKIYNSRINGTRRLVEVLEKLPQRPKVFVSASAIGIYGNRGDEDINEESTVADDFLGKVCKDWENEANKARNFGARVVIIRTGVVLGRGGGALEKMLPVFKMGVGGPLGSGKQYLSWIHIEDLASMYLEALKNNSIKAVLNGTAPYPATNAYFSKMMGKVLRRPAFLPTPAFAMKIAFGEMSQIILEGQKVLPVKFKEMNFRYRYPTLEMALKETA
ncbi:MAG: TIGR01777 family protein, partial [Bdellovibrionales bacterium]|nr:TIGR01777 family protein [Bdellovibrionales bacterium]